MDDTLPGPAHLEAVQKALDELDRLLEPVGVGISVTAASLTPVSDGAWPELEVAWILTLPDDPHLAQVSRTGILRLPYGREWLDMSFYREPSDYAQLVRSELERAVHRELRPTPSQPSAVGQVPASEVADEWTGFLAELEDLGQSVREVRPGRVEVDVVSGNGEPAVLTFLITPAEWADLRHRGQAEYGLGELLGAYEDDETFFRYDGTGFSRSVREELPGVRGTATLRKIAAMRAKDPDAKFGWFAYPPRTERETGQPTGW